MRRRLLILMSLLVLLMQPIGLLHELAHGHGLGAPAGAAAAHPAAPGGEQTEAALGIACLDCLAFAALGGAVLPVNALAWQAPPLSFAAPAAAGGVLRGGTGAGYHARGPPFVLA